MISIKEYCLNIKFRLIDPDKKMPVIFRIIRKILALTGKPSEYLYTLIPYEPKIMRRKLQGILKTPKMSTYANGSIINKIVSHMKKDEAYVNVGVWHGFSLLAGISGNPDKRCVGIDNFSEFGGPKKEFLERFNSIKSNQKEFYEMDYVEYFKNKHNGKIGFYFYDGEHSYENQLKGLQTAEPFFSDNCIIMVDDINWDTAYKASKDFIASSKNKYEVLFEKKTISAGHPTFWNGLLIFRKCGKK